MRITDVMNRNVASCTEQETCLQAAQVMRGRNVGFLVVTDVPAGRVMGVVTDRDILMAVLASNRPLAELPLGRVMSKNLHTCHLNSDLPGAHITMRQYHVRRLPVLDGKGKLVGIVSLSDLARRDSSKIEQRMEPDVTHTLAQIAFPHVSLSAFRSGI